MSRLILGFLLATFGAIGWAEPQELDSDVERAERIIARADRKLMAADLARRIMERADRRARDAVAKTSLGKAVAVEHAEQFYRCILIDTALLPDPLSTPPQATNYDELTKAERTALKPFADKSGMAWPPEEGKARDEAECRKIWRRGMSCSTHGWIWPHACVRRAREDAETRVANVIEELRGEFVTEELQALVESMSERAVEEVRSEIETLSI